VLVVVEMARRLARLQLMARQTQAAVAVDVAVQALVALLLVKVQAVQVLSYCATPAQFNILLVAQFLLTADMSYTHSHLQALWLQQRQVPSYQMYLCLLVLQYGLPLLVLRKLNTWL
jgi:hypothetical protein